MRFVVVSAFRSSSENQISRWARQVSELRTALRKLYYCNLSAIAVEGDSTNDTKGMLAQYAKMRNFDLVIVECNHGGPHFGSTEHPDRMEALSKVGNAMLSSVGDNHDVVIYVESDLIWDAETICSLVEHVIGKPGVNYLHGECDVAAPLIFAGEHFYDIFVFRKDGDRFSPFPPYHSGLASYGLTDVDSAGSCLVMKGEVARRCRIRNSDVLIGFCADAKSQGYRICVDPSLRVNHP